ncbi:MAG: hypothetical protein AAF267_23725 [Deinococcota bacterium]
MSNDQRGIFVPAEYVRALNGNSNAAIYLAMLVKGQSSEDCWFGFAEEVIESNTGLNKGGQASARNLLTRLGVIDYTYKGSPRLPWVRVNKYVLAALIKRSHGENHG